MLKYIAIYLVVINIVSFALFTIDLFVHKNTGDSIAPPWLFALVTILGGALGTCLYFIIFFPRFISAGHPYDEIREEKDYYKYWRLFSFIMLLFQVLFVLCIFGPHNFDFQTSISRFIQGHSLLFFYLALINIVTFFLFLVDKLLAIADKKRIRESVLLLLSFFGGALGGAISMRVFHHKTHKQTFALGLCLMILFHLALLLYVFLFNPF